MMKADNNSNVFMSRINQLGDELGNLDEVVSIERLTNIILDALPAKKHSTIKKK